MSAPAGWYPDANGVVRWWDGYRWTDAVQQPPAYTQPQPYGQAPTAPYGQAPAYAPAVAPEPVAPGTSANTVWVWLIVLMPLAALISTMIYLAQLQQSMMGFVDRMPMDPELADPGAITQWESSMLSGMISPWYLIVAVLGWAIYGLSVWFAYLDVKELRRRGFTQPFHWAWTFLSSLVYVIGRAVVVRRRGGRAYAPMWIAIAITVGTVVITVGWAFAFTADFMQRIVTQLPTQ